MSFIVETRAGDAPPRDWEFESEREARVFAAGSLMQWAKAERAVVDEHELVSLANLPLTRDAYARIARRLALAEEIAGADGPWEADSGVERVVIRPAAG